MSCANCDATLTKYAQSTRDCERLLDKLREYQRELDQCQAWIGESGRREREAAVSHEAALKTLLARLGQLATLDHDNHADDDDNDDSQRPKHDHSTTEASSKGNNNPVAESMQVLAGTLIQVYKSLKLKDFETKYESTLTALVDTIAAKHVEQQQQQQLDSKQAADLNNNHLVMSTPPPPPPPSVKVTMAIHQELNEYRAKSQLVKEKLSQQKQLIQSLLNKINAPKPAAAPIVAAAAANRSDENHHYVSSETTTSTTSSSCTSNSTSSFHQRLNGEPGAISQIQETYQCPKCQVQIDSSRITLKKLESHVKKCEPSKLVCIFCLKLYEQTEQVLFENHVQKHLIKQTLEQHQQQQQASENQKHNMTTTAAAAAPAATATFSTINNNSI